MIKLHAHKLTVIQALKKILNLFVRYYPSQKIDFKLLK